MKNVIRKIIYEKYQLIPKQNSLEAYLKNTKEKLKKEKKSREENVGKSQFEKNWHLDHYTHTHKKEHKTNINKD